MFYRVHNNTLNSDDKFTAYFYSNAGIYPSIWRLLRRLKAACRYNSRGAGKLDIHKLFAGGKKPVKIEYKTVYIAVNNNINLMIVIYPNNKGIYNTTGITKQPNQIILNNY